MNQDSQINIMELINYLSSSKVFIYTLIIAIFCLLGLGVCKCKTEHNRKIYSAIIFIITAIMGVLLYFIGYKESNGRFISGFRAIISTARMFFLDYDYSEIKNTSNSVSIMNSVWFLPIYWAVHVLALISSIFGILALFGRRIIEKMILFFNVRKTQYVICGANSKSLCLANSLISKKNRVVVIIDINANETISKNICDLGAILIKERILNRGAINNKLLKKIGFFNKYLRANIELLLLEDDEIYNISIARAVINVANENKVPRNKLRIFIELNNNIISRDIEETLKSDINYDINIVSEADIATRKLMRDYPIFERLDIDTSTSTVKDKEFTILIIGFGKIGRDVLFKSICNGQFISKDKKAVQFNAIVVDNQWENKSWQFRNEHKYIEKQYPGITFKNYSSQSVEFFELLKARIDDINYIVIATENDYNNLELAQSIQTFAINNNIDWGKKIMAVHMRNQSNLFTNKDENAVFKYIKFFGEYESIFTEEIIIDELIDKLAKKVNEYYNYRIKQQLESDSAMEFDNWKELSLFNKNTNRAVAAHLSTKLALLGYKINKSNTISHFRKDSKLNDYANYEQLENLSRLEHLRWNAFHFVNGWTQFTYEEIEQMKKTKDVKLGYNDRKNYKKRKHACLVPWEELADISHIFSYKGNLDIDLKEMYPNIKDFQLEDLKQISNIPEILSFAGISVKKNN